jgi:hypothetical protein
MYHAKIIPIFLNFITGLSFYLIFLDLLVMPDIKFRAGKMVITKLPLYCKRLNFKLFVWSHLGGHAPFAAGVPLSTIAVFAWMNYRYQGGTKAQGFFLFPLCLLYP